MTARWDERPLGSVLEVIIDHRGKTPTKLGGDDFTTSGVPVVSAIHIKNGRIEWDRRERFVPHWMFEKWMPVRLRRGDVLLTSEAPLGGVAQVPTDDDLVLSQRLFALRGLDGQLDSTFLRYFLQSSEGQSRLAARASGSTVAGIRQAELVRVSVPVPDWEEQRRIAGVLGVFDALIEADRRLIKLLLGLAVAAFESFRPSATRTVTYAEIADIGGGGTPSTSKPDLWNGDIAWVTPSDMTSLESPFLFGTSRQITKQGLAACSSDLYPPGSILMTSRATIGVFALAEIPTAVNQGFIVVQPRADEDRPFLLLEMMSRVSDYLDHANGSTFLEISRGRFKALPVSWPSKTDRQRFAAEVEPLLAGARDLEEEIARLSRTRDDLLPLVMSGRVRVSEDFEVA